MAPPIHYAEPGTIPRSGEAWRAVGCKTTVLTMHLLEAARVRPLLPSGLTLLAPWPGTTIGGTLLTCYGPGSTLEYHEFGVIAGWVRHGGHRGFYVSHLYVDSEASVEGGRRMGYPKEFARFGWPDGSTRVAVSQSDQPLCTLRWSTRFGGVRFPLTGTALSRLDDRLFRLRHRVAGRWSPAKASLEIPAESSLAVLGLGRPVLALVGSGVTGALGFDLATFPLEAPYR